MLLLRRADKAGALAAGHFSLKRHHYVYFLSFQRVFGELLVELQKWFDEQKAELTTTVGVEHLKVRTYCLDESTGLFQSLEDVLREKDFQPPKLLTREELSAPPVQPPIPNSTVWFVLPAMVSGTTARSCLDFAEALGASTEQVSVVAARVDADVSRFYQGLQRYRDINTRFQFMFHVPLHLTLEGRCPACALRDSFRAALDRIGNSRHHLRELLQSTINQLEAVAAQNAGTLGLESRSGARLSAPLMACNGDIGIGSDAL